MSTIPRVKSPDSTLSVLRDGYTFIARRRRRLGSDIFRARLMGEKVICMGGPEAAAVFYDTQRFRRAGAAPSRILKSLFGEGGVQTLDGDAHARRKAMFLSLMSRERLDQLRALLDARWRAALDAWPSRDTITLLDETQTLLMSAACAWSGVPVTPDEARQRGRDMGAMVDGFAAVGPRHWRARLARRRSERWIKRLIVATRDGALSPPDGHALHTIAWHVDADGALLDPQIAAVEVLNVLRPIVAIAVYISFLALALHQHPDEAARLRRRDDDAARERFVQEVRRFYPFTPFVGARVRQTFSWHGCRFPEGRLVLLDVYGADHDPAVWSQPDAFSPDRFKHHSPTPFDFIPQGGGDHRHNHRCAGERLTIDLMKRALTLLTREMRYEVPEQDLSFSLSRVPARPESGFVMRRVRKEAAPAPAHHPDAVALP